MPLFDTLAHLFHPRRSNNHRPKLLHPEALFALALIAVGFAFSLRPLTTLIISTGEVLGYSSTITATQVVSQTNAERAKLGLSPLTVNSQLNEAALAKAQNMFQKQYWAHVAPDGTQPWYFFQQAHYNYRLAGENLARDFSNTDDMMRAWIASPTHRANIMNANYQEIGVAVVDGKLLGTETTLVVQLFGTQQTQAPQALSDAQTLGDQTPAALVADLPSHLPDVSYFDQALNQAVQHGQQSYQQVLGGGIQPLAMITSAPLFSPLELSKAFFLAVIIVVVFTLVYDGLVMQSRNTLRLVGKNLAHILLLLMVAFLIIFFKGGVIG